MRLWHYELIPKLDNKRLCSQWRECLALLGNGWGKKHKTVNYVFTHSTSMLVDFTYQVFDEMIRRGYNANKTLISTQLEKRLDSNTVLFLLNIADKTHPVDRLTYPEHNVQYYEDCVENLKEKGIIIK